MKYKYYILNGFIYRVSGKVIHQWTNRAWVDTKLHIQDLYRTYDASFTNFKKNPLTV